MGKHKSPRSSARRLPRISFTPVIVVFAIISIGALTVASKQKLTAEKESASPTSPAAANLAGNGSQFQSPNAQSVQDPERIANGLKQLVNQSTEGLVEVQHADGTVSVNLDDRFQNVTVARVNRNGSLSQACVDNPRAAGAFFGIDPKLIDNQPTPIAPARKEN